MPGTNPPLRDRLRAGEQLLGTFVKSCDAAVTEILAGAGFDFIVADLEHSSLAVHDLEAISRAAALHQVPVIVRLASDDLHQVGRALDAGAIGIQVSDLADKATIARVLRACAYPPAGTRSLSLSHRGAGFGQTTAAEHLEQAERELILIGQVESVDGIALLPELLPEFPRIDLWFLGSLDLSVNLGHAGSTGDSPVVEVLQSAAGTILAAGSCLGVFAKDVDEARAWLARGATITVVASDYALLAAQSRSVVRDWRLSSAALQAQLG